MKFFLCGGPLSCNTTNCGLGHFLLEQISIRADTGCFSATQKKTDNKRTTPSNTHVKIGYQRTLTMFVGVSAPHYQCHNKHSQSSLTSYWPIPSTVVKNMSARNLAISAFQRKIWKQETNAFKSTELSNNLKCSLFLVNFFCLFSQKFVVYTVF